MWACIVTHECVCTHMWWPKGPTWVVFLSLHFLRQGLSLNLGLSDLAGQRTPGICHLPLFITGVTTCGCEAQLFKGGSWSSDLAPPAYMACTLPIETFSELSEHSATVPGSILPSLLALCLFSIKMLEAVLKI